MSVKTYSKSKSGGVSLNNFLKVKEFACNDGSDSIKISDKLPTALTSIKSGLSKYFGITVNKTIIVSGYRTPRHDKVSGGSGSGPHTKGWACDFYMTKKDGTKVNSIYILCTAQLLGTSIIKGLERITESNVHIDVERKDKWYAYQKKVDGKNTYPTISDWFDTQWATGVKRPGQVVNVTNTKPNVPTAIIKRNSKGASVRDWQEFLAWFDANKGDISNQLIVPDGVFGAITESATKAFQRWYALKDDGIAGPKTYMKAKNV